jgi:hypothetical protein
MAEIQRSAEQIAAEFPATVCKVVVESKHGTPPVPVQCPCSAATDRRTVRGRGGFAALDDGAVHSRRPHVLDSAAWQAAGALDSACSTLLLRAAKPIGMRTPARKRLLVFVAMPQLRPLNFIALSKRNAIVLLSEVASCASLDGVRSVLSSACVCVCVLATTYCSCE